MPTEVSSSGCCHFHSLVVTVTNSASVVLAEEVVRGFFNFGLLQGGATLRLRHVLLLLGQATSTKQEPSSNFCRRLNAMLLHFSQAFAMPSAV